MEQPQLPQVSPQGGVPAATEGQRPVMLAQADVTQQSLLYILWRRRWSVLLVVAACLGAGFAYLGKATPLYTSTSRLYVERRGPRIITEEEGFMVQSYNYVYTQCELLKSMSILASAVEISDMRQMKSFGNATNIVGVLKSGLKTSVGKKDEIISVSFDSPYPEEAAQVVNTVVDAYVTYHAKQKRNTAAEVLKILRKEKTKRDAERTDKLKAMLDFKQANVGLAFETKNGNIILGRLARLADALNTAQLGTIDAKADYESLKTMMSNPAEVKQLLRARRASGGLSSGAGEEAPVRAELNRVQLHLLELRREFTDTHPAVQAVESKKADLEKRLAELAERSAEVELAVAAQTLRAAEQREAHIRRFFEEQRQEALGLNAQLAQYTMLQSGWEQTKKLCDILDDRIKEINVTEDTGALNIIILEVARPASSPTSPRKTRTMAMALVLGLMLGVGLALARDWMDQRIRSAEEIPATLGMAVLGVVPELRTGGGVEVYGRTVELEPSSHAAEAYRTIRTAIYFGVPNGQAKTLLVTSPSPADGKTTVASNLAIAMAQAGQRTIVVDADFRRPMQHKVFEIEQDHGLSSVLAGRTALEDAIHHTAVEGLDVLPCGQIPPNPSEMLNSRAFAEMLEELCKSYDHIVLDSPPVVPVTDARILGATCDVTLLVLRAERSHRKGAERARDDLSSVGANILGVVVNAVPRAHERYYYHYYGYRYYRYRYRYGYGDGHGRRSKTLEDGSHGKPEDDESRLVPLPGDEGAD